MKIKLERTVENEEIFVDENKFSEMKLTARRKFILKVLNALTEELLFNDNIVLTDVLELLPTPDSKTVVDAESNKTTWSSNWEI